MKVGIDALEIKRFADKLENNKESFLNRHFSSLELKNTSIEHLAGIFCAKEAIFKTGYLEKMDFLAVQIVADKKNKPEVFDKNGQKIISLDVSISHTSNMAIAIVLWQKGS